MGGRGASANIRKKSIPEEYKRNSSNYEGKYFSQINLSESEEKLAKTFNDLVDISYKIGSLEKENQLALQKKSTKKSEKLIKERNEQITKLKPTAQKLRKELKQKDTSFNEDDYKSSSGLWEGSKESFRQDIQYKKVISQLKNHFSEKTYLKLAKGRVNANYRRLLMRSENQKELELTAKFIQLNEKKGYKITFSPYGSSSYSIPKNDKVSWGYKPKNSYRMADHWGFTSQGSVHCKLGKDGGLINKFTIGKWNGNYYEEIK